MKRNYCGRVRKHPPAAFQQTNAQNTELTTPSVRITIAAVSIGHRRQNNYWPRKNIIIGDPMTIRFDVNQAEAFRRGVNCEKSVINFTIDPAKLPQEERNLIANRLVGIDVAQLFVSRGQIVKGWPAPDLVGMDEPCRIVANLPDFDSLMEAIRQNEKEVREALVSYDIQPVEFVRLDAPLTDETSYVKIQHAQPASGVDLVSRLKRGEKVMIDQFKVSTVEKDFRQLLAKQRYLVKMVPINGANEIARFYFDPPDTARFRFRAPFMGKDVASNTSVVLLNERTGSIAEVDSLQQGLALYLRVAIQPRVNCNELDILQWAGNQWIIIAPEGIQ